MKVNFYITHHYYDETAINSYEFSILPTICLVKDYHNNKQLFLHWLIFGLEINF